MHKGYQKIQWLSIVANPFFLAIPFALLIIWFLPNPASKYKAVFIHQQLADKPNSFDHFYDLNGDGKDEHIIVFHNMVRGEAAIKIMDNREVTYDQWNFHGQLQTEEISTQYADLNGDGFIEIYLLYYRSDSILMAGIQPYPNKNVLFTDRLITRVRPKHQRIDYQMHGFDTCDFNSDGHEDFIISIVAGFSKQPRGLFIFDLHHDTLIKTNPMGAYFGKPEIVDMDDDGVPEILCGSSTIGNIHDSLGIPYSDYSSWFFYFDHQLRFVIPPIQKPNFPSRTSVTAFTNNEGEKFMAVLQDNFSDGEQDLIFYHPDGSEYNKISFEDSSKGKNHAILIPCILEGLPYLLVFSNNGVLHFANEKLETKQLDTEEDLFSFYSSIDLDGNGTPEYIFINEIADRVTILDQHFIHPVVINSHQKATNRLPFAVGVKHNGSGQNLFFIKADEILYYYKYKKDGLYYMKYPLWLLVYLLITAIFWVIQRLQSMQTKRKLLTEETINSLQMRTIKNQLDPHFMFNVLNGLANNVAIGNTAEAHNQILRFSKLMRALMRKSDRIDTNLKDELDFVESYLELEKFRFKEDFEYSITINETTELTTRIPKMLVQLLVENGIKHGLRNKTGLKRIHIEVNSLNTKTQILITDNGIGRKAALKYKTESGKGLSILQDMVSLNKKLGGKEIQVNYTDLFHKDGTSAGTRAELLF